MNKPLVILLGSKPASVAALAHMVRLNWDVRCVVSSDFKYDWIAGVKLHEYAEQQGIPVVKQAELENAGPVDLVISYMFRYLVKEPTLNLARTAAVNFHAGELPRYAGWAFYSMAILEQAARYGVTCHHMDAGFDTGDILKIRSFPIEAASETACSLERQAQRQMLHLFGEFCEMVECGEALPKLAQDPGDFRYLSFEEFTALKQVPEDADEHTVDRHARAFWYPPYPGAYTLHNGVKADLVPGSVKRELAEQLHANDLDDLMNILVAGVDR